MVVKRMRITKPKDFRIHIQQQVDENSITYMDAIMTYYKEHSHEIEIETIAKMISGELKENLENECANLNLLVDK